MSSERMAVSRAHQGALLPRPGRIRGSRCACENVPLIWGQLLDCRACLRSLRYPSMATRLAIVSPTETVMSSGPKANFSIETSLSPPEGAQSSSFRCWMSSSRPQGAVLQRRDRQATWFVCSYALQTDARCLTRTACEGTYVGSTDSVLTEMHRRATVTWIASS